MNRLSAPGKIATEVRDLFLFFSVSLLHTKLSCWNCDFKQFLYVLAFTFCMWVCLWKGNSLLSEYLSRKISWITFPARRLLAGVVINIGYTVLAVVLLIQVFESITGFSLGQASIYTVYGAVIVTILISFFLHARSFLFFWRKAASEKERFEKESIIAKYESLKSQVSPHFLFNSLNALTSLVYLDPEKAVKFIKQLSEVYRYVLDTRDKEVVSISEELDFIRSYLYLQDIRFGKRLVVRIAEMDNKIRVAPLALQMLIENAIKHNIASEEQPLTISLYSEGEFLVVENNLQKKDHVGHEESARIGLDNICRRYAFLSNKKVSITEKAERFVVKVPILNHIIE